MRLLVLLLVQNLCVYGISTDSCGVADSCWLHPPGCHLNSPADCVSGVKWHTHDIGVDFEMFATVADLDSTMPVWMSVGFSHNQRMDDDTVIECLSSPNGSRPVARISFNDDYYNTVLHEASLSLLSSASFTMLDDEFTCSTTFLFNKSSNILKADRFKIHNLESKPYFLLFARGNANPFTMEKEIHFMNDGPKFPWMSRAMVTFCSNCSHVLLDGLQNHVPRYWRYRIAVFHGICLTFCWWVLISNALLIARFFKPLWPRRKLLGAAVWFQLHRTLVLFSLPLQLLSILLIFYQANWVFYECSYACELPSFTRKLHTLFGVSATVLAMLNPILALFRPAPDASFRRVFNWLHWFIGMSGWIFASITICFAIPQGKTALQLYYGVFPFYIVGGYIVFFVLINIFLEMLASSSSRRTNIIAAVEHTFVVEPSGMALSVMHGPSSESPVSAPKFARLRICLLGIHLIASICVTVTVAVLLLNVMWDHSP